MDAREKTAGLHGRRNVLKALALAGATGFAGLRPRLAAAEPPPETTRIRLARYPVDVYCTAPQWVAEPLLRAEGFRSIEYVTSPDGGSDVGAGNIDITLADVPGALLEIDAGKPIAVVAGIHGGCYELFGGGTVRSVRDLRGRTVAVASAGYRAFVASMASYVGLDPRKDIKFITSLEATQLFIDGKADAVLGFPPTPQELRARKVGHVVVNTAVDRPWSQHFCCVAIANREFVRRNPVAVKRALRSIIKATEICASDPERVARMIVERGYVKNYESALQVLKEVPYRRWREYDSADTIRFFALRMHEAGVVTSNPKKLIERGTDWRFVTELKKELKA